jgi:hypothetical protein
MAKDRARELAAAGQLEIKFPIRVMDCEPLVVTDDLSDDEWGDADNSRWGVSADRPRIRLSPPASRRECLPTFGLWSSAG